MYSQIVKSQSLKKKNRQNDPPLSYHPPLYNSFQTQFFLIKPFK
jgi:hypothetical protein